MADQETRLRELEQRVAEMESREDVVVSATGSSLGGRVKGRGLRVKLNGRVTRFDFSKSVRFTKAEDFIVEHASSVGTRQANYTFKNIGGGVVEVTSSDENDDNTLNIKITSASKPGR